MKQVRVYRVRPDAKLPARAHKTDAGMDFFFCPPENAIRRLQSGDTALLETGVKVEVPPGFMLQIMNLSLIHI